MANEKVFRDAYRAKKPVRLEICAFGLRFLCEVEGWKRLPEEPLIRIEASSEELPAIDAAIRGYIQLLRFAVDPSHERDEVVAQLRSFQQKYEEPFMAWRARRHSLQQSLAAPSEPAQQLSWQVTTFELMAFDTAVIGYLHVLEKTRAPIEVRNRMINHLLAFEQRYHNRQGLLALNT